MSVYTYRDLLPLATFTRTPVDIAEGWLLWAKIAVVALASIAIPLIIPRQYTPVSGNVGSFSEAIARLLILINASIGTHENAESRADCLDSFPRCVLILGSDRVPCK
jgi:hypothetical protein